MKKLLVIFAIGNSIVCSSQSTSKFHVKYFDFGFGTYIDGNNTVEPGFSGFNQLAAAFSSNIILFNGSYGFASIKTDNKGHIHNYFDLDLLYGRELKISPNFTIELQTGFGYITQIRNVFGEQLHSLAIPINLKIKLLTGKKVDIGVKSNITVNDINTIYSLHLFLEYNRKKGIANSR